MPPDDPRSDELLVDAANRGDAAAFEALYHRNRDWVARLAYRFTGDRDEALDVVQEVFIYFLGKFPGFRLEARLTTFLYPAVKNTALNLRRKTRRMRLGEVVLAQVEAPAPAAEGTQMQDLQAVLQHLPDAQREVLLLRFVDGLSLAEVAGALGIPVGTVKSRLHLALRALREDPRTNAYFAS